MMMRAMRLAFLHFSGWVAAAVCAAPDPDVHLDLMIGQPNGTGTGTIRKFRQAGK